MAASSRLPTSMTRSRGPASLLAATLAAAAACGPDAETARLRETTRASYDKATGKLTELTYDADKNGRIDTWTEMDGSRPVRSRIDRNEDGRINRWEYYYASGKLAKVGLSRADDGKPDAWAYAGASGRIERIDASSVRDESKIDRWEYYGPPLPGRSEEELKRVEQDTNGDGRKDTWEAYEGGVLKRAEFDENADGVPDRRLTYAAGGLVLVESEPDGRGGYRVIRSVK
jgi:hypothetical protein